MWKRIEDIVSPNIEGHTIVPIKDTEILKTSLYTFGGRINNIFQNSVYKINCEGESDVFIGDDGWKTKIDPSKVIELLNISSKPSKLLPEPREFHSMVSLQVNKIDDTRFLIFGGIGEKKKFFNDVWIFDCIKLTWAKPKIESTNFPCERYGHSTCIIPDFKQEQKILSSCRIILYGGFNQNSEFLSDIWLLKEKKITVTDKEGKVEVKEETWEWKQIDSTIYSSIYLLPKVDLIVKPLGPCGRVFHTSIIVDKEMIIFGGKYKDQRLNDMWSLNLENYKWKKINYEGIAPTPRYGHMCITIEKYILITGGHSIPQKDEKKTFPIDLYICDTEKFEWGIKVNANNKELPQGRLNTAYTAFLNGKLIVYGGYKSQKNKLKPLSELWICETGIEKRGKILNYQLFQELGRGAFASVVLAIDEQTKKSYALKRIQIHFGQDGTTNTDRLLKEIEILNKFNHPGILSIVDSFLEPSGDNFIIVMPVCKHGTLINFMRKQKNIKEPELLDLIIQFLEGMVEIHNNGIVHRDIKPENILVSSDENEKPVILISDFGLATYLNINNSRPSDRLSRKGSLAGTPGYIPPELFQKKLSYATDLWAVGSLLAYFFTKYNDFGKVWDFKQISDPKKLAQTVEKIVKLIDQKLDATNYVYKEDYKKWIHECFDLEYEKRPLCEDLLSEAKNLYESLLFDEINEEKEEKMLPTVNEWLDELKLEKYKEIFENNGFDDIFTVSDLNEDDLNELGIQNKELLEKCKELKEKISEYIIPMDFSSLNKWLESVELSIYENNFVETGFDDFEIMSELTTQEMKEFLKITKLGHLKRLKMKCKEIKELF